MWNDCFLLNPNLSGGGRCYCKIWRISCERGSVLPGMTLKTRLRNNVKVKTIFREYLFRRFFYEEGLLEQQCVRHKLDSRVGTPKGAVNHFRRERVRFCNEHRFSPWQTTWGRGLTGWSLNPLLQGRRLRTEPYSWYLSSSWMLLLLLLPLPLLLLLRLLGAHLILASALAFIVALLAQDVIHLFQNKRSFLGDTPDS